VEERYQKHLRLAEKEKAELVKTVNDRGLWNGGWLTSDAKLTTVLYWPFPLEIHCEEDY